jgi:hypothetical protein
VGWTHHTHIYLLPIPFFAASILATMGHMELLVNKVQKDEKIIYKPKALKSSFFAT